MRYLYRSFIDLIAASINPLAPKTAPGPGSGFHWDLILNTALEQTMLGIIHDSVLLLPPEARPDPDSMTRLGFYALKIEQSNRRNMMALRELSDIYRDAGLRPVLLKGLGLARYYPLPAHRNCGDIDLCFSVEESPRAYEISRLLGSLSPGYLDGSRHLEFTYKGVHIEIHAPFAPDGDPALREWFAMDLNLNSRAADIGGVEVNLPSATYDAVYVFAHACEHLESGGLSFRQIIDWMLLLDANRAEVDMTTVATILESMDCRRYWNVFGSLGQRCTGVDFTPFMIGKQPSHRRVASLASLIFLYGNFGYNTIRGNGVTNLPERKLRSAIRTLRIFASMISLSPKVACRNLTKTIISSLT